MSDPSTPVRVHTLVTGAFVENGYILHREGSRDCVVIDPGAEPERWIGLVAERGLTVAAILGTHCHLDHVGAVRALQQATDAPYAIHADEVQVLDSLDWQCDTFGLERIPKPNVGKRLAGGETLSYAGLAIDAIAMPGHTPGGMSYHVPALGQVFTGDSLFAGTIGRTDLPGGDHARLIRSLTALAKSLPDDTIVAPGHGPESTIGIERRENPFFRVER